MPVTLAPDAQDVNEAAASRASLTLKRAAAAECRRMKHSIQVLTPQDLPLLRRMLAMFADAFEDPASYASQPPGDAWLDARLRSDSFVAIVALDGAEVVGGLAGYVLPKFEQQRTEFYIYDLAVAAAWRRRGVATGLIGELQRLAEERGWYVIYVQADQGDDPAVALYTKLGTREDVMHFDIAPGRTR